MKTINKERCIYEIKNKKNGKRYIGSTRNKAKRWREHKNRLKNNSHVNPYLQSTWNKYGANNFAFNILEKVSEDEDLLEKEQVFLDKENPEYNVAEEAGASMLGRQHTEETKQKMSEAHKGKEYTEEMKQKMIGENNPMYGKHRAEAVKQKIGQASQGRTHSKKIREKMSKAHKGNKCSENAKAKIRGEGNGNSKLTKKKVKIIKHLLGDSNFTHKKIGKMFGVANNTITDINTGRYWNHVTI